MTRLDLSISGGEIHGGGRLPFESERWFHTFLIVINTSSSLSACDITVSLVFENMQTGQKRAVDRALFIERGPDGIPCSLQAKMYCLKPGDQSEVIAAIWSDLDSVQTLEKWSPELSVPPRGEELHLGNWRCEATVRGQNLEASAQFYFKAGEHSFVQYATQPGLG